VTHRVAFHKAPHVLAPHAAVHHHQTMSIVVQAAKKVPVKVVYQPVAVVSVPLQVHILAVYLQAAHQKVQNQAVHHALPFHLHV